MALCGCSEQHAERRRIVVTGGPGAGKTAALELIRQTVCVHVRILPEAAGIVFGGGFPREAAVQARRAAQRAIFYVQRELEAASEAEEWPIVLCDRGTVDGAAYWPSEDDLFESVGTKLSEQLLRYDTVIHMRTPSVENGYHNRNPLRVESAAQARAIDERIAELWAGHPHRFTVDPTPDFMSKAVLVLEIIQAELPECCRRESSGSGRGFAHPSQVARQR